MTNEQINIAIAEACGWAEIDGLSAKGLMGKPPGKLCSFDYLPDYCNDLNAMHEAEKLLISEVGNLAPYKKHLAYVTCASGEPIYHATARQRARAFLETLGLLDNGSV